MDVTTARPSLLGAAKNFIRKSAGTAVLAVAPLAAISVAPEAEAQVAIFGGASLSGGSVYNPSSGGHSTPVAIAGAFSTPLSLYNNVEGVGMGATTLTYSSAPPSVLFYTSLSASTNFYSSNGGSGTLPGGAVPTTFNFDIVTTAGISNLTWSLSGAVYDSMNGYNFSIGTGSIASGGSPVNFTGAAVAPFNPGSPFALGASSFTIAFDLSYDAASSSDTVVVSMIQGNGQGIFLNAPIPEPSTYALVIGLGALGLVAIRRSRRVAA